MKRKLVSILLGLSLSLSIVGCNSNIGGADTATDIVVTTEETGEELNLDEPYSVNVEIQGASYIQLSDDEITIDGDAVTMDTTAAVYVANDVVYYEEGHDFTYGEGKKEDEHSKEEADKHTVVHITRPGTYVLSGELSAGQIAVDLGEDAEDDPEAVVTLVLNGIDITNTVAPGVIFYNVYECSSSKEEDATKEVDTSAAGANVLIPDGTNNIVRGSYVARIYKSVELNEEGTEVVDSKKLHKYDAAFYSKMSMNIDGGEDNTGKLNIYAENEGLGTELHLTLNGGTVSIISGNDGINTNEDNVSVTTINDGYLYILVDGETGEGDGIDSNGWLVINGGAVHAAACSDSMDAGIDSDKGIHINGGIVIATGNMLDHISESNQNYVVFTFQDKISAGEEVTLKKGEESIYFSVVNDYTYLIVSYENLTEGTYTLWKEEEQLSVIQSKGSFEEGKRPHMPEGMEPGQMPEGFEEGERPEMPEGVDQGQKPEGGKENRGEKGGREQGNTENAITEFEIKNGGNIFTVVTKQ